MNHWAFVTAAYAVVIVCTAGLSFVSWRAMVRAEAALEALKR